MNEQSIATHLVSLLSAEEHITGIQARGTEENDVEYTVTVHVASAAHRAMLLEKILGAVDDMKKDLNTELEITIQLAYDAEA